MRIIPFFLDRPAIVRAEWLQSTFGVAGRTFAGTKKFEMRQFSRRGAGISALG